MYLYTPDPATINGLVRGDGDNIWIGCGTVVNSNWYHSAFTYDESDYYGYRNGARIENDAQATNMVAGVDPLCIGRASGWLGRYFGPGVIG